MRAIAAAVLLALAATAQPSAQAPVAAAAPLQVMSFNIRYGTAKDGENAWPARRALLFDVLREQAADIIGLQEALAFQIDEILAAVPGYAVVGVGRDDGARKGEFAAILYRRDRLAVAAADTFWFSDTPTVPGSTSWGNTITRICSWARFVDRQGQPFYHFNVHLDHQSQPSRERSTRLLRERIAARAFPADPVVVTGDFNVGETNPAIVTLTGGHPPAGAPPLVDTFRARSPDATGVGTFTGFVPERADGDKLDYVLVEPSTEILGAGIVRTSRDDRYPSDHFPVVATIRFKATR